MNSSESGQDTGRIHASRPQMPEGYLPESADFTLLPWEHAETRLQEARNYWIATVRPDGRPHAVPVWGVWLDNRLYFDGSPETRRGRNLAHNSAVSVHLENGNDVVIVEGDAHQVTSPSRSLAEQLAQSYQEKYPGYSPQPDQWDEGGLYVVIPHLALGWDKFPDNCTRWHFESA